MHQNGVIHRDLNPTNVFVIGSEGFVKILDFNVSKLVEQVL
jgi:serine/threonine protein kinase